MLLSSVFRQTACLRGFLHRALHVPAPTSTTSALALIRSQPSQYIVANFLGKKYILTPRDVLTVPRMKDVNVGDIVKLDAIHELGSREYTLRGNPTISADIINVEATVLEHTKSKMETKFKKKRRKGYRRTIKSKHPYTRLRIGDIQFPAVPHQAPILTAQPSPAALTSP